MSNNDAIRKSSWDYLSIYIISRRTTTRRVIKQPESIIDRLKILLPKPEAPPIFILQPISCPPHLCLHPILSHPVPSPIPHKSHLPSVRPACQAPTKFHPLKPYSTHAIRRKVSAESIKKYPEIRRRRSAAAHTYIRKCVHITYKPPNILAQPSFWAFNIPPTTPSKSHVSSM